MRYMRIKDWSSNFENNRTRNLKHMAWVPIPNKQDGDGYTQLVGHKDGAAHLGVWVAILQIASKCEPRGTLVRGNGKPHDPHSLARMSHLNAGAIGKALDRLIDSEIGWLEYVDSQGVVTVPQEGAAAAHEDVTTVPDNDYGTEGKGTEQKEQKERYGEFRRVSLSDQEYKTLIQKHGQTKADAGIAELDAWMERTGKRRKNHYACMNEGSWVWEKVAPGNAKPRRDAHLEIDPDVGASWQRAVQ